MKNVLRLFTDGKVTTGDGREFTRMRGGIGGDKPMFLSWQAGELLGKETKIVKENFENNESKFEEGVDFIDLKSALDKNDSDISVGMIDFLKDVGYLQNKLNATKRWLAFSFDKMMKLVKIATTKEPWDIYNNFLEDYFRVEVLEKTLEQELEAHIKERKYITGELIYCEDEVERFKLSLKRKELDGRIENIKVAIATRDKDILIAQYKPKVNKWEQFLDSNGTYSFTEAAKLLSTMAAEEKSELSISVGKLTEFLREQGVLNKTKSPDKKKDGVIKKGSYKNLPNKEYENYFNVVSVNTNVGFNTSQTRVKAKGVEFIYDLVKEKYIAS